MTRRHFDRLYLDLRSELKRRGIGLDYAADVLGITRRSLEMKLANIEGSTFRINEMYALLHMLCLPNSELARYFPEQEMRRRIG